MDRQRTPQAPAPQSQTIEDTASHHERVQIVIPSPGNRNSNGVAGHDTTRSQTSSAERHLLSTGSEGYTTLPRSHENPYADFEPIPSPPAARSRDGHTHMPPNRQGLSTARRSAAPGNNSGIDWIVPMDEKGHPRRTVGDRLQPTIDNARIERDKYAKKALWTSYALNIAIGLQVFLGALTTGLAAAVSDPKKAQISTSVLGGLATMVASYLARARGSGEPELSITRVKDLEQFLRECMAFQIDHAHEYSSPGDPVDFRLDELRRRFEELLGNANGERKLSPVGITATHAV